LDATTTLWIRNAADERAARDGCWFDPQAAAYVVWWVEYYCTLYEGSHAGERLWLRGTHDHDWMPDRAPFDVALDEYQQRLQAHAEYVRDGAATDWQLDAIARAFGWQSHSQELDRPVRRFTDISWWVPKKNKKSPTLAALGLYLLCGDGEPGQKVYFGAKDGGQARDIAGKHAVEMMDASHELSSECRLNKNLCQITHTPTKSILKPISSGDTRSQKSKEGLNGSLLVDETHVVDRAFMNRVDRCGISRDEPIVLTTSTAGNDPDCYGKERRDYGEQVNSGHITDSRHMFAEYAAPETLTDAEMASDPVKYGKLANPAWGHTIKEAEYLADYRKSSRSITALADFKMYRLNMWQKTASPWIRSSDWERCRRDYTMELLRGQPCVASLDLSKTRDMSALVLMFEQGDEVWQLPWFYLPEYQANQESHRVNYLDWAEHGWLTLTPGDVVDYAYIEADIARANELFDVQELVFDPMYARDLATRVDTSLGIDSVEFPQTIMHFGPACAEYERRVIAGTMCHNGNPILSWQAGHVQVKTDANNNRRPVKPKNDDHKKIDGIVAAIMGTARVGSENHAMPAVY